jgi:hypothetical protein
MTGARLYFIYSCHASRMGSNLSWPFGGIAPPYGGVSRDLRLNFTWRHRHELEAAVQTMLSSEPERMIFAHGRWHGANDTTELRNAFSWLLK